MNEQLIRVALCDDHRLIVEGVRDLLQNADGVTCVGATFSGEELLYLLEHVAVDVVLLDLDMPGLNGAETLQRIRARRLAVKVVILTMNDAASVVRDLMNTGAQGFLLKTCGRDELLLAIREVHAGRTHFSGSLMSSVMAQRQVEPRGQEVLKDLTEREVEVLAAVAEGLGNKEIAEQLFISPRTVDKHRTNIMAKLGIHNVAGLVRIAIKAGLVK